MKKRVFSLLLALLVIAAAIPAALTASAEALRAETYPVIVNGEEFTSDKLTIACGDGTATLDPTTSPNTLILNGADITEALGVLQYSVGIYSSQNLRILVTKESRITLPEKEDADFSVGIFVQGNLYIDCSNIGKLLVEAGNAGSSCGIFTFGDLVNDGTVSSSGGTASTGDSYGIHTGGCLENTASLLAQSGLAENGNARAVYTEDKLYNSGYLKANSPDEAENAYAIYCEASVVLSGDYSLYLASGIASFAADGYEFDSEPMIRGRVGGAPSTEGRANGEYFTAKDGDEPFSNATVTRAERPEAYPVLINGEQFTEENLVIPCGTGTATLDPGTVPYTLTLDHADIVCTVNAKNGSPALQSTVDLKIFLIGSNRITMPEGYMFLPVCGINVIGDLTVEGEDSISTLSVEAAPGISVFGIDVSGTFTNDAFVSVSAGAGETESFGVMCDSCVNKYNRTLNTRSGASEISCGIYANDTIRNDGYLTGESDRTTAVSCGVAAYEELICGDDSFLNAGGDYGAVLAGIFTLDPGLALSCSVEAETDPEALVPAQIVGESLTPLDSETTARTARIAPEGKYREYGILINNISLAENALTVPYGDGEITLDPFTAPYTLTMQNCTMDEGTLFDLFEFYGTVGIYAECALDLVLVGENTIDLSGQTVDLPDQTGGLLWSAGIYAMGDLFIKGKNESASLTIKAGDAEIFSYGIMAATFFFNEASVSAGSGSASETNAILCTYSVYNYGELEARSGGDGQEFFTAGIYTEEGVYNYGRLYAESDPLSESGPDIEDAPEWKNGCGIFTDVLCCGPESETVLRGTNYAAYARSGFAIDGALLVKGSTDFDADLSALEDAAVSEQFIVQESEGQPASRTVLISEAEPEPDFYSLWVDGERFTDSDLTIVCGGGTATLDPTTVPYTLTLDNISIKEPSPFTNGHYGIYSLYDLKIVLRGSNTISLTELDSSSFSAGIYVLGNLTIESPEGSGLLSVHSGTALYSYGIFAEGDFVNNGAVNARAGEAILAVSAGVYASGTLTNNRLLNAFGGTSSGYMLNAISYGIASDTGVVNNDLIMACSDSSSVFGFGIWVDGPLTCAADSSIYASGKTSAITAERGFTLDPSLAVLGNSGFMARKIDLTAASTGSRFVILQDGSSAKTATIAAAPEFPVGDVNGDGEVTITDYLMVKAQVLGTKEFDAETVARMDVNEDGEINVIDYLRVKKIVLEQP